MVCKVSDTVHPFLPSLPAQQSHGRKQKFMSEDDAFQRPFAYLEPPELLSKYMWRAAEPLNPPRAEPVMAPNLLTHSV